MAAVVPSGVSPVITALMLVVGLISSLPYAVVMGGIIAIVAFVVLIKWADHMQHIRNPLDKELSQASHGAALILLGPLLVHFAFYDRWTAYLPPNFVPWVWPACYFLMALGAFWLVVGVMRSRTNYRDAQLIARAMIKIALGCGLFWMLYVDILPQRNWPYKRDIYLLLLFVSLFCVLTGLVKFGLLMRGPPGRRDGDDTPMPHGGAAHPTRGGLG
jgi:hypothetical protein